MLLQLSLTFVPSQLVRIQKWSAGSDSSSTLLTGG